LTCLVTIHGIGFQQFPEPDKAGYADGLHQRLVAYLPPRLLGDDPSPKRVRRGEPAPVYVQSSWPPGSHRREAGLARLGTVDGATLDIRGQELVSGESRVAHVALVYSGLEGTTPDPQSMLTTLGRGVTGVRRYATWRGLAGTLIRDVAAILRPPSKRPVEPPTDAPPSQGQLSVRTDVQPGRHPWLRAMQMITRRPTTDTQGTVSLLRTLEDDVAAYVCRDDLRARVRDFVRDALTRIALRPDVCRIVINAHSQGTVIAFDVLRELDPQVAAKVRWLITAGSPLRKYARMLSWTTSVSHRISVASDGRWCNVWDEVDPVADPLGPAEDWRRGQKLDADTPQGLFALVDGTTGDSQKAQVVDCKVDNANLVVGSGLRAHDYWGNERQFVIPLAAVLEDVAQEIDSLSACDFGQSRPRGGAARGDGAERGSWTTIRTASAMPFRQRAHPQPPQDGHTDGSSHNEPIRLPY
jgi:hypothetical protein